MSKPSILVVGSLNMDLVTNTLRVPKGGETITAKDWHMANGGKGANQAVACVRLSKRSSDSRQSDDAIAVRMVGAVGSDDFGKRLKSSLAADGIDVAGVQELDGVMTGVATILVEESSGENRILITAGANGLYRAKPSHLEPAPSLVVLQLEVPLEEVKAVMSIAASLQPRVPVVFNPAPAIQLPAELWAMVDHLILNETEAALLSGADVEPSSQEGLKSVAMSFLEKGVRSSVIVTLGEKGAYFYTKGGASGMVPAIKVKAVDTTAAGDTFVGAFSVKIVGGASIEEAVSWAIGASSKTVQKSGAQDSIPWLDEL